MTHSYAGSQFGRWLLGTLTAGICLGGALVRAYRPPAG